MAIPESVLVLIPILVGVIGVPAVNWLKQQFKLEGIQALWLAFAVSVVLAIFALVLVGGFVMPPGGDPLAITARVIEWVGLVFATATLIYKSLPKE